MFYFRQLRPLAALGCDVYGVDLLGHGLSSRPAFDGKTREEGETFYTDALQAWVEAEGLEHYVLLGHSFGGYVASCWALAHPQRVLRLILVGSAGMEQKNRACLGPKGTPWGLEARLQSLCCRRGACSPTRSGSRPAQSTYFPRGPACSGTRSPGAQEESETR